MVVGAGELTSPCLEGDAIIGELTCWCISFSDDLLLYETVLLRLEELPDIDFGISKSRRNIFSR